MGQPSHPSSVDPVHGMDPVAILDPATRNTIEGAFATRATSWGRAFVPAG
jgi:hypothetical protein